jgi:hypothetical protein
MTGHPAGEAPEPPDVDHPDIAAALQELAGLDDRPLTEHQTRLSRVHEVLHEVLHPDRDAG